MELTDLLKGKMVNIMTDAKVVVQLEIESVEQHTQYHSEDLEPSTQANDWWPATRDWTTSWIAVKFVNGYTKKYESFKQIDLVQ
jgi:hypothetical protein